MARRKKQDGEDGGPTPAGSNGYDPDVAKSYVSRVEALHGDLASERGTYMANCKSIREDINLVLTEAKDKGIPKKALRAVLKIRDFERKAEAVREDSDAADDIDMLRHALGDLADTDLGKAALEQAA